MLPSHSNTGKWLLGAALVLALGLVLVLAIYAISPTILASKRAETSAGEVSAPRMVPPTATSLSTPSPRPQGTSTPQLVSLRASATDLKVGDIITLTAVTEGLGTPYYTIRFKDDPIANEPTDPLPELRIQRGHDLFYVDLSTILKFESIKHEDYKVIAVFRAVTPGATHVGAGIYGETAEGDGQGKFWWVRVYRQSEDVAIRVSATEKAETTATVAPTPRALPSTATSTPEPSPGPHGTSTSQLVVFRASAADLRVGDFITLTANIDRQFIRGGTGKAYYRIVFTPVGTADLTEKVELRIKRGGVLFVVDVSKILLLDSIQFEDDTITAVFQAAAPGLTRAAVGVYGEIGVKDAQGQWSFTWHSEQSEDLAIRVTE